MFTSSEQTCTHKFTNDLFSISVVSYTPTKRILCTNILSKEKAVSKDLELPPNAFGYSSQVGTPSSQRDLIGLSVNAP